MTTEVRSVMESMSPGRIEGASPLTVMGVVTVVLQLALDPARNGYPGWGWGTALGRSRVPAAVPERIRQGRANHAGQGCLSKVNSKVNEEDEFEDD